MLFTYDSKRFLLKCQITRITLRNISKEIKFSFVNKEVRRTRERGAPFYRSERASARMAF